MSVAGDAARLRALALFDALVDLPPAERATRLAALAADEPQVAALVAGMLQADLSPSGLLADAPSLLAPGEHERRDRAGEQAGPYRLVSLLGRGGMGEVWEAERTREGFRQRVAVKLLPADIAAGAAAARFRRERRILAGLEHPGIARFVDGGVADDGTPYLAMELVDGSPITAHVARGEAGLETRLALFAAACDAVAYAHRALVVHRDLKPSNVLVTADGQVKLLDFGIAKLLGDDGEESGAATLRTRADERVMTPAYAAPEQMLGEPVTTATDVWALGVLLYELLTGSRPFAGERRVELEAAVLRGEVERPSSRVVAAAASASDRRAWRRRLRGDLDAIVLRALQREPARRYHSAEALAEDVRAHLAGLPVQAQPDAFTYRAAKFVRRHRLGVIATAVATTAILGGLTAAWWQATAAARQGRRAAEVESFLLHLFEVASPEQSRGERVTARELLDEGARRVAELDREPGLQAELYDVMARLYGEIGLSPDALALARRGVTVAERRLGGESDAALAAYERLGQAAIAAESFAEAERAIDRAAVLVARRGDGAQSDGALRVRHLRAALAYARERPAVAIAEQRAVVAALRERGGAGLDRALDEERLLAQYLLSDGKPAQAEEILRRVVAETVRRHGEMHPATGRARFDLAIAFAEQNRKKESVLELRRAIAAQSATQGADHPDTIESKLRLARSLMELGRYDEAAAVARDALASARRARGEQSVVYGNALDRLGHIAALQGRMAEAERDFQAAYATHSQLFGPHHPTVLEERGDLVATTLGRGDAEKAAAQALELLDETRHHSPEVRWMAPMKPAIEAFEQLGRWSEAEALSRESLAIAVRTQGGEGQIANYDRMLLARALAATGRAAEAAPLIDGAVASFLRHGDPRAPPLAQLYLAQSEVRLAQGKPADALAIAERSVDIRRATGRADDWRLGEAHLAHARALAAMGRRAEARQEAATALGILRSTRPPAHPLVRRARELQAKLGG